MATGPQRSPVIPLATSIRQFVSRQLSQLFLSISCFSSVIMSRHPASLLMAACLVGSAAAASSPRDEFDPKDPPCHKTDDVKVGVYLLDLEHLLGISIEEQALYFTLEWMDDRNNYRHGTPQPGLAITPSPSPSPSLSPSPQAQKPKPKPNSNHSPCPRHHPPHPTPRSTLTARSSLINISC